MVTSHAFCSDAGIYDRVVIQELIKTAAQMNQLDASSQKSFKGISAYFSNRIVWRVHTAKDLVENLHVNTT